MDFTYPCKTCIVNACCRVYCIEYYKYINKIVRLFPNKMTRDQIEEYYESTPVEAKNKINVFKRLNKQYLFQKNSRLLFQDIYPLKDIGRDLSDHKGLQPLLAEFDSLSPCHERIYLCVKKYYF